MSGSSVRGWQPKSSTSSSHRGAGAAVAASRMGASVILERHHGSGVREGSYQPKPQGRVIQTSCGRCGAELDWSRQTQQRSGSVKSRID